MADTPKGKYFVPQLTQNDVPGGACCVDETSFATLFPGYLEKYVSSVWPEAEQILKSQTLKGEIDLVEGSLTVTTTRRTWDPYAVIKGRDFVKLLARNVPLEQAKRIFDEGMVCDIMKIGLKAKNTARFVKRRERLIGPEGQTLKALELLTDSYVLVQGKTVAIMGSFRGVQQVRSVVEQTMRNIHPVYGLKQLLIRKELEKREDLKSEDWSRFMPVYKKSKPNPEKAKEAAKKKKARKAEAKSAAAAKKGKSVFPPEPTRRKEDVQMASGEAFYAKTYKKINDDV